MLSKSVRGRAAVFIDAANLIYSQKTLGWSIDFQKLFQYLSRLNPIFVNYYFAVKDDREKRFINRLRNFGYSPRVKPLKRIRKIKGSKKETIWKGNLDIELAYDMLINEHRFDTCVLFSGDSDFVIVLKHLINTNHQVIIVSTKCHASRELTQLAHTYVDLKMLEKVVAKKTHPPGLKPQGTAIARV